MELSRLTQFHEQPAVIAWWRAKFGPALDLLTPARRRMMLAAGAVVVGVKEPLEIMAHAKGVAVPSDPIGQGLVILALFAVLWLCWRAALGFARLPELIRRRPQITLHALFWTLLAVLWTTTPAAGAWRAVLTGIAITFPLLIWRCGYMLLSAQRGRIAGTSFTDHLMYLWPVYGGSNTPHGKGLDYLSRHEAKDAGQLAKSQLTGLKLLILAGLWSAALKFMDGAVYGVPGNAVAKVLDGHTLGIPRLSLLLDQGAAAALVPLWMRWISLYAELFWQVLRHAAQGHVVIAILRLFGFNVFRNTYKPLLAVSVVDFWNRYYFYFKELLAEFFFLPTFSRWFRKWNRLRLFAAVFAAAFIGNSYYHLLNREDLLLSGDVFAAWTAFHSRLFYCLLLAFGIFLSMVRAQRRGGQPATGGGPRRVLSRLGVWTFFALIFIWNVRSSAPFPARATFFLGLFGLT